jgi:asparagine synthase (glutamine-hydrolysing)
LSEFACRHVTVVLTGEGADELFGGYKRYLYQSRFGWMSRVPGVRQAGQGPLRNVLPHRLEQALEAVGQTDPARNYIRWAATLGSGVASRLFAGDLYREYEDHAVAAFSGYFASGDSRLGDQLRADQHEWLPHNLLAKVDRASMAFSLEARVPFLDHRIVEWAARVPDRLKIDAGRTKHVLREAFRDELPPEIPDREKQGFDLPLGAWIRGPLRERVTDLLAPSNLGRWGALDAGFVGEMLDGHLQETQDFGLPLFNLLSIMIWLDRRR